MKEIFTPLSDEEIEALSKESSTEGKSLIDLAAEILSSEVNITRSEQPAVA